MSPRDDTLPLKKSFLKRLVSYSQDASASTGKTSALPDRELSTHSAGQNSVERCFDSDLLHDGLPRSRQSLLGDKKPSEWLSSCQERAVYCHY